MSKGGAPNKGRTPTRRHPQPKAKDSTIADAAHTGPRHVAIIMDGNGRWATQRGRPRLFGHHNGARSGREVVENSQVNGDE